MTMVTHWVGWTTARKGTASTGSVFPAEATVTAEDATNAAKLAGLGYVASPTTAWAPGRCMLVGTFRFYWNGTAWTAGVAPITVTGTFIGAASLSLSFATNNGGTVTWNFGDSGTATSSDAVVHTYAGAGTYTVTATMRAISGTVTDTASVTVPGSGTVTLMEIPSDPVESFDPSLFTVNEVEVYANDHPDEVQAILAAEEAGRNRVTLVNYLTGLLG